MSSEREIEFFRLEEMRSIGEIAGGLFERIAVVYLENSEREPLGRGGMERADAINRG